MQKLKGKTYAKTGRFPDMQNFVEYVTKYGGTLSPSNKEMRKNPPSCSVSR